MAIRMHVAGIRNVPVSELKTELSGLGNFELHESGGWAWFTVSVWQYSAAELLAELEKLPRAVLLATTEDASRWYLRLRAPGQEPYDLCHEFAMLGHPSLSDESHAADMTAEKTADSETPLVAKAKGEPGDDFFNEEGDAEDDSEYDERDLVASIVRDKREIFGCPLPEGVEEHLKGLPPGEAMQWLFAWEGAGLIGALKRFGIPHQADAIASIILGESVSEAELDSDVGNLPRLLVALGFGEYFEEWIEETIGGEAADNGEEHEYDEAYGVETEIIDAVLDLAESQKPKRVTGEPVALPLASAHAAVYLALFCDPGADVVFYVRPASEWPPLDDDGLFEIADDDEGGVYIAPDDPEALFMHEGGEFRKALSRLPDETEINLFTGSVDMESGIHQYRGIVRDRQWRIVEAAPCAAANALRGALELARALVEKTPIAAADQAELNAVLKAAEKDPELDGQKPKHDGLHFRGNRADLTAIAKLLFRHRYRDFWDVREGERADAEEVAEWEELKSGIAEAIGLNDGGPVIIEGATARFIGVDTESLNPPVAKAVAIGEERMREAGFAPIGALSAEGAGHTVMCGYVHRESDTYGVVYPDALSETRMDCYTRFSGDVSLTTSTTPGQSSRRAHGIYHRTSTATTVKDLFAEHQRGCAILRERGHVPEPIEPTIEGLARAIDDYLTRRFETEEDSE